MFKKEKQTALAGAAAGFINGLLGAGGGLVLIPLMQIFTKPKEEELFPMSVSIMLPICIVSLITTEIQSGGLPYQVAWPFLLGGFIGGCLAGLLGKKIPVPWLHRGLGIMILWGGIRYLC